MIMGYKNILIVTGGKELNYRTKMKAVTGDVIKNVIDERLSSNKGRRENIPIDDACCHTRTAIH